MTVDFSGGYPIPAAGLVYDGGANGPTGDTLRVVGTAGEDVVYMPDGTTTGKGTIEVPGSPGTISFTGLEPIVLSSFQSLSLVTPNANDELVLSATTVGGVNATTISGASGGLAFENATVYDVAELRIEAGADPGHYNGNDRLVLNGGPTARALQSLLINLGVESDEVELAGAVDMGSTGELRVTGEDVDLTLSGGQIVASRVELPLGTKLSGTGTVTAALVGVDRIEATGPLSLGTGGTSGFNFDGTLVVGSNTVTLNSTSLARLGTLTTIDSGTLNAAAGITLPSGGVLQGSGTVNGRISASFGSTIDATGDLLLGDSSSFAGFASDGELYTGSHTVTLLDRDVALLGTLTALGAGGSLGTLVASNSLTVDSGHTLAGYGTVTTPNQAPKAVVNNGNIAGDSMLQPLTLSGYVKGAGTFDNVQFTGTYSPGLSPTQQQVGSIAMGASSTLVAELGGTEAGSQYDQLVASGTVQLGGTLQVALINGFSPALDDQFEIVAASGGSVRGSFANIVVPGLPTNCTWDVGYSANSVSATATAMKLDGDGNGTADALSDGILLLRYLFDQGGSWNVNDALGSGATRPTRPQIKTYLDGGRSGVLDADGNGTADALSDGILILRYLFDPSGAWNVNDALGSGATRTTRDAIKAHLDGFNPGLPAAQSRIAASFMSTESPLPRSISPSGAGVGAATTQPITSTSEQTRQAEADQFRAAISQSLLIGGAGTSSNTDGALKSMPEEGSRLERLLAVDTALELWDPPALYGTTVESATSEDETAIGDEETGQLRAEGDQDWLLTQLADAVNGQNLGSA